MSSNVAIEVRDVTKIYKLYDSPIDRLKEGLSPFRKRYHREFFALNGVSLKINKGDTVGILGQNGAGKSTLLKIITGVLSPSSGEVTVNGRVSALLELGAGFDPDISGLENVYFNGTLMGFSREEIDSKLNDIFSFAEIGDYFFQPVKTYSSGMFVRLAFSLAVHIDPEILIVDEALAVGDTVFQNKCMEKIKSMMNRGVTTLFVTHSLETVNTLCNKAYVLDAGKVFTYGKAQVVTLQYYQLLREREHASHALQQAQSEEEKEALILSYEHKKGEVRNKNSEYDYRYGTKDASIIDFKIFNSQGAESNIFRSGERFVVQMLVEYLNVVENPCFGITISNVAGQNLLSIHTFHDGDVKSVPQNCGDLLSVELETTMALNPGKYLLSIGAMDTRSLHDFKNLDARKNILTLEVFGKEFYHGIVHHEPKTHIQRGVLPNHANTDGIDVSEVSMEIKSDLMIYHEALDSIDIEVSGRCNAHCSFCPRERLTREVAILDVSVFDTLLREIREIRAEGPSMVYFTGLGEPLYNRNVFMFADKMKKAFPNCSIGMTSNGTLLDKGICDQLISSEINGFECSFQSVNKVDYETAMGRGSFDRVVGWMSYLAKNNNGKVFSVSTVINGQSLDEIEEYRLFWEKIGVNVSAREIHNRGGFLKKEEGLEEIAVRNGCGLFNSRLFVAGNGDVLACCHDLDGQSKLGTIGVDSLLSILDKKRKLAEEKQLFPMCSFCNDSCGQY